MSPDRIRTAGKASLQDALRRLRGLHKFLMEAADHVTAANREELKVLLRAVVDVTLLYQDALGLQSGSAPPATAP